MLNLKARTCFAGLDTFNIGDLLYSSRRFRRKRKNRCRVAFQFSGRRRQTSVRAICILDQVAPPCGPTCDGSRFWRKTKEVTRAPSIESAMVRDASGSPRLVKKHSLKLQLFGLLWAVGYETEINYLVPRLTIPGKGTFEDVRLEARPANEDRLDEWKWEENPFAGTRQFQGLKIMMLFLENWDIKDSNNEIIHPQGNEPAALCSQRSRRDVWEDWWTTGVMDHHAQS